jgi:hypothetical protein
MLQDVMPYFLGVTAPARARVDDRIAATDKFSLSALLLAVGYSSYCWSSLAVVNRITGYVLQYCAP